MRKGNQRTVDGRESPSPLSDWLLSFEKSQGYASLAAHFGQREGHTTPPEESAMLYALVRQLRPEWSLEIGTFFAHTTRIIAEAIVDAGIDGKLITLDPFGQKRVPEIVGSWPEPLAAVTDFRPWTSMRYFLELETLGTPKGADSPLGVVFVDGHHNFEYALFDIIRSADHLAPGGAIMVDNLEQEGPKVATIQFLRWNPAWNLFYQGTLLSADTMDEGSIGVGAEGETLWGVLLAPTGIQVTSHAAKLIMRNLSYAPIRALTFNVRHISHPGTMRVTMVYYAVPFDFHLTGQGMVSQQAEGEAPCGNASTVTITFPSPLELEMTRSEMNVCYEIELSYRSDWSQNAYAVLDARTPVLLQS